MSVSTCPLCKWPIRWILTEGLQRIAVDPEPCDHGTIVRIAIGYTVRGRVLTGQDMPWQGGEPNPDDGPFVHHLRTCGRHGRAPKPIPCTACGTPLHPIITARAGRFHWLCAPAPRPTDLLAPATAAPAPEHEQTDLLEDP